MRLAYRHRKASRLLLVERLKESAPRAGFFEDEQYKAVQRHLPADLSRLTASVGARAAKSFHSSVDISTLSTDLREASAKLAGTITGKGQTTGRRARGIN